jgi:hypothetical protein
VALNLVELTLDVYNGAGQPIQEGTAFFSPSTPLTDTTEHQYVWQTPVPVALTPPPGAEEGWLPTISLYATDNSDLSPLGWVWSVSFQAPGAPLPFSFELPYGSGADQYLSGQVQLLPAPSFTQFLPNPTGTPVSGYVPVVIETGSNDTEWLPQSGGGGGGFGWVVLTAAPYSADPTGTSFSDTAMSEAVSACAASGQPLYIPAGEYKFADTVNWKVAGLKVITAGMGEVKFNSLASNAPIVQVAGMAQDISGLTLQYNSLPSTADTSSIAFCCGDDTVGDCFLSSFTNITVQQCNTGIAINPAVEVVAGLFSCDWNNIHIYYCSYSAINIVGGNNVGAGGTGNTWSNVYIHNNWDVETGHAQFAYYPVFISNFSENVFNQLNVEQCEVYDSDVIAVVDGGSAVFNSLHFEGVDPGDAQDYAFFHVGQNVNIVINGLSNRYPGIGADNNTPLVKFYESGGNITIKGFYEPYTDGGVAGLHPYVDFNSQSNVSCFIEGVGGATQTTSNSINTGSGGSNQTLVLNPGFGQTGLAPSGDTTGARDYSNIMGLVGLGVQKIQLQGGTFYVNAVMDWKIPCLVVQGAGASNLTNGGTVIKQVTANTGIIEVAGQNQDIGGFTLTYASQQTSAQTGAIAMALGDNSVGSCFASKYHEINIELANTAMGIVSTTVGGAFSCTFENFKINGYSYSAMNMAAASGTGAANCTGCVFDNIYIQNNYSGSNAQAAYRAVDFTGWDEAVFNQLNIEHGDHYDSDVLFIQQCGNVIINGLHYESLILAGNPGYGFLAVNNGGSVIVNGMTIRSCTIDGTDQNPVVRFNTAAANVVINSFYNLSSGMTITTSFPWADFGSTGGCTLQVNGILDSAVTTGYVNGAAGDALVVSPFPNGQLGLAPSGDTTGATDAANLQGLVNLGISSIVLQAGQFYGNTPITVALGSSYPYCFILGAGRWATQWNFTGTGDAFRIYGTATSSLSASGGIKDLTIDGSGAGAGSAGLHQGDARAFEVGCAVQNFSGTGDYGVHFDNQYAWSEETHGYLWLSNNTQNLVFDVSAPASTTVAAGSNGGEISQIATWAHPSAGVLDVASAADMSPTGGTINVAASGSTTAVVTYTGVSGNSLTGCAYVSGSATGTVSTGGAVGLVTSTNSFGYNDLTVEILAKVGQDGVVLNNGATPYNGALRVRANFQGSASAQTNAVLRIENAMPAGHSPSGGYSKFESMRLDVQAECSSTLGTNAPQTIAFGTLSSNAILGCSGILDFAQGSLAFATSNWTATGATGFVFDGAIRGDFNLNNATVGLGSTYSFTTQGPRSYGKALLNAANGNLQVDNGDFFSTTLSQSITVSLNPSGAAALASAQRKTILVAQPATGGTYNYTVTWPKPGSPSTTNCAVYWPGGVAPVQSTGAGATDKYELVTYDGAHWYGVQYANFS